MAAEIQSQRTDKIYQAQRSHRLRRRGELVTKFFRPCRERLPDQEVHGYDDRQKRQETGGQISPGSFIGAIHEKTAEAWQPIVSGSDAADLPGDSKIPSPV